MTSHRKAAQSSTRAKVLHVIIRSRQIVRRWSFFVWGLPCTLSRLVAYACRFRRSVTRPSFPSETPFSDLVRDGSIWVINLDKRSDRRLEYENEFSRLQLGSPVRFSAVFSPNGFLGCASSHLEVLRRWERMGNSGPICVVEDDLEFLVSKSVLEQTVRAFLSDSKLDVMLLGYRTRSLAPRLCSGLRIITNSLTTSGYIVKPAALQSIIESAESSVDLLSKGASPSEASIDVVWQKLQCRGLIFATGAVRMARQRRSFSDIEGVVKDRGL